MADISTHSTSLAATMATPALLTMSPTRTGSRWNGLIKTGVKRFTYTYDFGDSWDHVISIEKTEPAGDGQSYPAGVEGKRNCPPEDCGGAWGYAELLEILADPAHPERAERLDWMDDEDFDPEAFDIERANRRLAAQAKRR